MKLDRSKWKFCEKCKYEKSDMVIYFSYDIDTVIGFESWGARYCPECGQPLVEEAWEELERKVFEE